MKKANFIINHLKSSPYFKNVLKNDCYKKLLNLLPHHLQNSVFFMYNKNGTLFFVVKHPVYKMEFNYKISLIKELLKMLIATHKECACIKAENIKVFVTNRPKLTTKEHSTLPFYKEKSMGNFQNHSKNEAIHKLFETIRTCIKNSNKP